MAKTMIIDEVSGDSMRVVRDGEVLLQKELALQFSETIPAFESLASVPV